MQSANQNESQQAPQTNNNEEESPEKKLLDLEMIGYANAVNDFIKIDALSARSMIANGEYFYLYVGRMTCQWCRKLAPSLQYASSERGIEIYYLDSSETDTDGDLSSFRDDYAIETVPAVILFDENGISTRLDINIDADDMNDEVGSVLDKLS